MGFEVEVVITDERTVPASPDAVFALLSDVPRSIAHFPELEALTPEQGGYRWTMQPAGVHPKVSIQTIYACRYETDAATSAVRWTPIPGVGNGVVTGGWTIEPAGAGARFTLHNELRLTLELPRLLRKLAKPLAVKENTRLIAGYLDNLVTTLQGGDGRVARWSLP